MKAMQEEKDYKIETICHSELINKFPDVTDCIKEV